MKPLVTAQLKCSTQNNANQVRTFVQNKLATVDQFALDEPVTAMAYHSQFLVNASVRCNTDIAADELFDWVVSNWTSGAQANRILSGSVVRRTNNYDDEGQGQADEVLREAIKP